MEMGCDLSSSITDQEVHHGSPHADRDDGNRNTFKLARVCATARVSDRQTFRSVYIYTKFVYIYSLLSFLLWMFFLLLKVPLTFDAAAIDVDTAGALHLFDD